MRLKRARSLDVWVRADRNGLAQAGRRLCLLRSEEECSNPSQSRAVLGGAATNSPTSGEFHRSFQKLPKGGRNLDIGSAQEKMTYWETFSNTYLYSEWRYGCSPRAMHSALASRKWLRSRLTSAGSAIIVVPAEQLIRYGPKHDGFPLACFLRDI